MIKLENLTKHFDVPGGQPVIAASNVNMEVAKGDICVFLGPSGCGKTTALKMVNRLIPKTLGKIYIDGKDTDELDAIELRRGIGYVIQQIGLFPNMTIEDNICVVPDLLKMDRNKSRKRAVELLDMVNLEPKAFLNRYPNELSGGQQQRIGVIRGLAANPPVMLMDEPFGAIDPINRAVIQDEFLKLNKELGKTVLFVSHDIDEAIKMGDQIAIFREGILEQCAEPDEILANPANDFVKDFVGIDMALKRLKLLSVKQAILPIFIDVKAEDKIDTALRKMEDSDTDIIVMTGPRGRVRGFVNKHLCKEEKGLVGQHALSVQSKININENLHVAVANMYATGVDWLAVVDDDGKYKGYLDQHLISSLIGETTKKVGSRPS